MSVPSYVLFELGFGFKYQYLMSALIHTLITKKINFSQSENYIKKNIKRYSIHSDCTKFITQVQSIIPDVHELKYNINSILMLEGENSCFEDINLFTTNNISQIRFFQVKGSMSDSYTSKLNNAVIHTLKNTLTNKNIQLKFQLIILVNREVSNYFFAKITKDKIKIIVTVINSLSCISTLKKQNKSLYIKFLDILEEYIETSYKQTNSSPNIYYFFYKRDKRNYPKYKVFIKENSISKSVYFLKYIIQNTKIIESLDYRLIYFFLKNAYGNDKLTKLLWNIEMEAMNGKLTKVSTMRNQLFNIGFNSGDIKKINFTKKTGSMKDKFKIGKIL